MVDNLCLYLVDAAPAGDRLAGIEPSRIIYGESK
jgi:hypothetical protein